LIEIRRETKNDLDAVRHVSHRGFLALFYDESVVKEIIGAVKYGDSLN